MHKTTHSNTNSFSLFEHANLRVSLTIFNNALIHHLGIYNLRHCSHCLIFNLLWFFFFTLCLSDWRQEVTEIEYSSCNSEEYSILLVTLVENPISIFTFILKLIKLFLLIIHLEAANKTCSPKLIVFKINYRKNFRHAHN